VKKPKPRFSVKNRPKPNRKWNSRTVTALRQSPPRLRSKYYWPTDYYQHLLHLRSGFSALRMRTTSQSLVFNLLEVCALSSRRRTKVPGNIPSRERKFPGTFVLRSESSRELLFLVAKVPTGRPGSEKS